MTVSNKEVSLKIGYFMKGIYCICVDHCRPDRNMVCISGCLDDVILNVTIIGDVGMYIGAYICA